MALQQVLESFEALDSAYITGDRVAEFLMKRSEAIEVQVTRAEGTNGYTEFVRAEIQGAAGRSRGGDAPTLGIIGRLGGIGARPERIGFVSDGDGALVAVACAAKLAAMHENGDKVAGDVIITTHIAPRAGILPHEPVPFISSPVGMDVMNRHEVDRRMEALLCVDTARGNRVINTGGFAISATVKEGYILRVSEDLLDVMEIVTGIPAVVVPITQQDITPYGNGLYHLNSILQPSTATTAAAVGVALTSALPIPGSATGAVQLGDVEAAVRFCIEVAKRFGTGGCSFWDVDEFTRMSALYGSMRHFQTPGRPLSDRDGPRLSVDA